MDEKVFNLIEQMQANMMAQFEKVNERFEKMDKRFDNLEKEVQKISISLEQEVKPNIKLLLQEVHDTNERVSRLESKVDVISDRQIEDGVKLDIVKALFEKTNDKIDKGNKITHDELTKIKEEVAKHEEFIIKRVK